MKSYGSPYFFIIIGRINLLPFNELEIIRRKEYG